MQTSEFDDLDFDTAPVAPPTSRVTRPARTTPSARNGGRQFPGNATMRVIAASILADVPTLIWGQPGTAKTALLTASAEKWGYFTQTIIGSIRDTTDMLGLPIEQNGEVIYAPPAWARRANDADKSLLIFDEFTTGASIMAAMLRVIQEREVGEYRLSPSVRVLAIANPPECAVNGVELAPPMANRFIHLNWTFDSDGWLAGLSSNFVNAPVIPLDQLTVEATDTQRAWATSLVTSYLQRNRKAISPGVPKSADQSSRAWASPRSWTNLMNILVHLDPADTVAIGKAAEGAVGEGEAKAFKAYVTAVGLFDPEEVLADPTLVNWADSRTLDRLFALTMSVSNLAVSRGDKATWEKAVAVLAECHRQGRHDTPVVALRELLMHRPATASLTKDQQARFSEYIV